MSEELLDEIEAINSIYGEDTLTPYPSSDTPDSGIYILRLPPLDPSPDPESGSTSSLRLQFPAGYPAAAPPAVVGTHSSSGGSKRGAAARDLQLFRGAVAAVYAPGQVCLFDAFERFKEDAAASAAAVHRDDDQEGEEESAVTEEEEQPAGSHGGNGEDENEDEAAPWVISDPVVELKSTFVARCAAASSPAQAARYIRHLLASDRRVRGATHNMTAWRIRGAGGATFQDCDDDGETAAGGRLLHLMQLMDLWDTVVVVTRWYGGQKLGPRRFALINTAARDAFVKAGLVSDSAAAKRKGHGK
ncbi:ribosomal protein S5 domain 2-type protein [Lasiosphaeria miniovina]|uniref:Ribosomal protein S5 domain 2-type protein n=1 Tax=Lasiosphaeria miniovina TaxID=1954250 RepID=A0AA40B5Q3_9PEZI|nr:ribosomal protein S5 domain 2-type protein [Lasiosphaeria miniovina]KAK0728191.1 ribosomal protein S5 domain 2-type protein [Lasiosphaeria miniovina]